jgi:hypothetical protein
MKSILLILVTAFAAAVSSAQKKKPQFHSINSAGIIGGESPAAAAYETVNGFAFSSWFAGLGAGIDNYHFKSVPLFLDGRKFFGTGNRVFVLGNVGGNLPVQKRPAKEFEYHDDYYFQAGFYAAAGIGYRFPFIKKTSLVFNISNSYKSMKAKSIVYTQCLVPPCLTNFKDYHYNFYRIMVKAGLMF